MANSHIQNKGLKNNINKLTTETLNIILWALLALTTGLAIFFFVKYRRKNSNAFSEETESLKRQLRQCSNDLDRYKTLYTDLQNSEANKTKLEQQNRSNDTVKHILSEAESLMMERKQLEEEKSETEKRNRKLWEMSVSIQKEKQYIATLKNDIESKHRAVTDSIRYARYIQLAVLPSVSILENNFNDYFLFWRPLEIVSGDFYWMKQSGDILAFCVADCTGHGVPGAFMSLLGITFLNEICASMDQDTLPSTILETLRSNIINATTQAQEEKGLNDGMDMALCTYNTKTQKLRYAGANNSMYLVRNGQLTEYKSVRNPIGYYPMIKQFESTDVEIQSGDWIYMFSDGMADQFGSNPERKLTTGKFRKLIESLTQNNEDGATQSKNLGEFLTTWRGNHPQMDDIMIGGYQIQ